MKLRGVKVLLDYYMKQLLYALQFLLFISWHGMRQNQSKHELEKWECISPGFSFNFHSLCAMFWKNNLSLLGIQPPSVAISSFFGHLRQLWFPSWSPPRTPPRNECLGFSSDLRSWQWHMLPLRCMASKCQRLSQCILSSEGKWLKCLQAANYVVTEKYFSYGAETWTNRWRWSSEGSERQCYLEKNTCLAETMLSMPLFQLSPSSQDMGAV